MPCPPHWLRRAVPRCRSRIRRPVQAPPRLRLLLPLLDPLRRSPHLLRPLPRLVRRRPHPTRRLRSLRRLVRSPSPSPSRSRLRRCRPTMFLRTRTSRCPTTTSTFLRLRLRCPMLRRCLPRSRLGCRSLRARPLPSRLRHLLQPLRPCRALPPTPATCKPFLPPVLELAWLWKK